MRGLAWLSSFCGPLQVNDFRVVLRNSFRRTSGWNTSLKMAAPTQQTTHSGRTFGPLLVICHQQRPGSSLVDGSWQECPLSSSELYENLTNQKSRKVKAVALSSFFTSLCVLDPISKHFLFKASLAMMFGPDCCSVLEKRETAGTENSEIMRFPCDMIP